MTVDNICNRVYIIRGQQVMLVTAKVSEISVQVAGVVDWKNKAEDRFDSIQRSIDTLNENFIAEASWCGSGFVYRKLEHTGTERRNSNGYTQTYEMYAHSDCSGVSINLDSYINIKTRPTGIKIK